MPTPTSVCSSCGAQPSGRLAGGLCPACLLRLAMLPPEEGADAAIDDDGVGPYQLVAVLDGDASRTVYLAERQASPRFLAVEVVRAAAAATTTAGTFRARVGELLRLAHPGIARVLGGSVTPDGAYCVVSEYVPGAAIDRYCSSRRPEMTERLGLVLSACRALEHAHGLKVLHGRLGANSIVVSRASGQTQAVVTGFGVFAAPVAGGDADVVALGDLLDRLISEDRGPAADRLRRVARAARTADGVTAVSDLIAAISNELAAPGAQTPEPRA